LQLWDTAGQERFRSMAPMYYRGATAAVIVFDASKYRSWDTMKTWHKDLTTYAEPGVIIGIAGNKADKPKDPGLDLDLVRKSCIDWGASLHFTSAITGEGVDDLFLDLAKRSAASTAIRRIDNQELSLSSMQTRNVCCS